jgi:hypothetical protein
MTPADIFPNSRLNIGRFPAFRGALRKERLMNLGRTELTGFPNDDISVLIMPLEDRPRTNA